MPVRRRPPDLLRKGGVHSKSRSSERRNLRESLEREVDEALDSELSESENTRSDTQGPDLEGDERK